MAACYLARAGLEVLVLDAAAAPGGGARAAERVPGYHFDLHSVAQSFRSDVKRLSCCAA